MYHSYDDYVSLYDSSMTEAVFTRIGWEACKLIDKHTTGVDGVKKLKRAFPTDDDDVEAVIRCACRLTNLLFQIETAEQFAESARGYEETANGIKGRVISSISSGTESVSFSASSGTSEVDKMISDHAMRDEILFKTIREYLDGVKDANGVSLLYMGYYPRRVY